MNASSTKCRSREETEKIIDELLDKHDYVYDGLKWYDEIKSGENTPMPESIKKHLGFHQ